jgi:hypothetical protein
MLFVRRDEFATITAVPLGGQTELQVRGKLDSQAATRLRALRVST